MALQVYQEYVREDGLSFGVGADAGYIYTAKCRVATVDEIQMSINRAHEEALNLYNDDQIEKLRQEIYRIGERPEGTFILEGLKIFVKNEKLIICGGGEWIVVEKDYVWAVQNNGSDGDNWSANNINTGGAGAIGYRVKITPELLARLNTLQNGAEHKS